MNSIITPKQAFCEYLGKTDEWSERYRIGSEKPSFYVLKPKAKKNPDQWGKITYEHDLYREQGGRLYLIEDSKVFEWLNRALSKTRKAWRNAEYQNILQKTDFYQSAEYNHWRSRHRSNR